MLGEWWDGHLIGHGTPEAELMTEMGCRKLVKLVSKHVDNAFENSDLDNYLKNVGPSELSLVSVMTNLSCETAARDAFRRDADREFFTLSKVRQHTSAVEYFESTLRNLGHGFTCLVTEEDLKFGAG